MNKREMETAKTKEDEIRADGSETEVSQADVNAFYYVQLAAKALCRFRLLSKTGELLAPRCTHYRNFDQCEGS